MANETTIDVRTMAPRDRHPQIFSTFDAMGVGDAILLINDHDPKPLFYQFQAERPGEVSWTPQEQGPERWVIRIERVGAPAGAITTAELDPLIVDVCDDLRNGREPFGRIMQAVASLQDGQAMVLIAIMEPVPLYDVMAGRGFAHETSRTPEGDWQIRFFRQ
jgi:uncharacterized protein (DUF2249 family)